MKKFAALWLLLALSACAIGKLEDAAEALDEAEKQLDQLDISGCMDVCSDKAEVCLEEANGNCIDSCQLDEDACFLEQEECMEQAIKAACDNLFGLAHTSCIKAARDYCDQDCEGSAGDCIQGCGKQAQDCLVGGEDAVDAGVPFADCMSNCIEEMQDILKDIDL